MSPHKISVKHSHKEDQKPKASCPFSTANGCNIREIYCSYGLTEIHVPDKCPLREGETMLSISATLIKS
jgi:hypothetical protein